MAVGVISLILPPAVTEMSKLARGVERAEEMLGLESLELQTAPLL